MGGKGSGRRRTRRLWLDCPVVDVMKVANRFKEEECGQDVFMTSKGYRDCWVALRGLERDEYQVEYEWRGMLRDVPRRQTLMAVPAYPNFGGVRWWWSCGGLKTPGWEHDDFVASCGRRVRLLFLRKGRWACRRCWGLAYESEWKEEEEWGSPKRGVRSKRKRLKSKDAQLELEKKAWRRMFAEFFSAIEY
jgi:hypothetical protein